ncbi:MAG: murein biosynthesis integral membrane protein MurJ [Candidatus Levybacteria bacterium RIFCSPHIGHO2_02_FULL_39_36]|nr:MAG: putative peptidoglycan lipid II flippase MurJ [Candidatus Levybacteria bacterium GW2011_GWA1_39_11]KKR24214.1 MAG: putative peptidoglycan lipid II flippase MurJ [Candidatus Levybacteria bacterium GW2011_GWB1_39_7]OGH14666.1 MAG: murein biosynthesis integral membrane protein MurJ [Candidatus Levybacteria bacterium RIFCSPHIGHO2_01_FULL_38_96]OGH25688.1 MAG: murein biosynthesis integral membrane protein MurJ [Candidatus Levybacteria bacterium RIFCSPHIGHO2_12_FULL_39_39]OGH27686.1 MAG: mure
MVTSLVKKGIGAFVSRQTNIFTAASFIILTTVFSQILGILKYRLLVSLFGASSDLGVFFAAFRIPDFVFQVVVAGALSASFIPIFTEFLANNKKKEAYEFTSALITIGIIFFIFISAIIIVFSYQLSGMIAPGFSKNELRLMANLMIIIQLSQVFFILGTIVTGMLQSFQHFVIPGLANAFYNFGIILGLIIFSNFLGFGIYGATTGVLIGAMLFLLVQLPLLGVTGFRFYPSFDMRTGIYKLLRLMVPRSLALIVSQIAATASVFFASFISARSLVIFDLAQTLAMAPVILLGQSIAQASFPALSLKSKDKKEFLSIFTSSFSQILYLTLPVSVILIVLRIPLVRLFYGASRFDWDATVDTGLTLAYFSIAVTANALLTLLSRAFYAFKDSKTPLIVTIGSVILNIFISYLLILKNNLPIYYLAFSFSLSSILGSLVLTFLLNRKIDLPKLNLGISFLKIFISSIVMGVALYIPIKLLDQLVFDTTRTINLLILTGIASVLGLTSYIFFTWLFDIKEAYYVIAVLKKFKHKDKILRQVEEMIEGPKLNP